MLFNSWQYILFLPLVALGYFLLPQKARWAWLLAASYYFYMSWNAKLVVLIATTTLVSYLAAVAIEKWRSHKKLCLSLAAAVSLGLLFFFKYFDFFSLSIHQALGAFGVQANPVVLNLMLPVGISFYTFQTLGYVVDVYRGTIKAERHLGIYALFVSFFPQLVAGPIERAANLLPQFRQTHTADPKAMAWGLRIILLGMMKKAVIADSIAAFIDPVFAELTLYSPMSQLLAVVFFALQIYCDFSGYSDIARGSAAILGFGLMENFKAPYFARSMQEFWRRWHISLSTWFQDYVYIPLGGSRVKLGRRLFNLFVTFLLSGLWHGASWNFVLWGCYNGILVAADVLWLPKRGKLEEKLPNRALAALVHGAERLATFVLACGGWVLFRTQTLHDAARIVTGIPGALGRPVHNFLESMQSLFGTFSMPLQLVALCVLVLLLADVFIYKGRDPAALLARQKAPVRAAVTYCVALLMLAGLLAMAENHTVEFIYFQF